MLGWAPYRARISLALVAFRHRAPPAWLRHCTNRDSRIAPALFLKACLWRSHTHVAKMVRHALQGGC
jgi:hypothetical protein